MVLLLLLFFFFYLLGKSRCKNSVYEALLLLSVGKCTYRPCLVKLAVRININISSFRSSCQSSLHYCYKGLPFVTMDTPTNGRDGFLSRLTAKTKAHGVHQWSITSSNAQGGFSILVGSACGNWLQYVNRLVSERERRCVAQRPAVHRLLSGSAAMWVWDWRWLWTVDDVTTFVP